MLSLFAPFPFIFSVFTYNKDNNFNPGENNMSNLVHSDALDWTRELLQARFISEVFADRMEAFVLKGGMAMRVRHRHTRSTQDVDLDASKDFPLANIQTLVRKAIKRSLKGNVLEDVEITEPKQTDTTARWRIKGIDKQTGQNLVLTVEISRRDNILNEDVDEIPFSPTHDSINTEFRPIRVYNNQALALRKVRALLCDARNAPRDIVDLYLLIKADVTPPIKEMRQWLKDDPDALSRLWYKIDSMDEKQFKQEVLPCLPATPQSHDLYKNWDAIRLEVGMCLEDWITKSQASPPSLSSKSIKQNKKSAKQPPPLPCSRPKAVA